MKIRSISQYAVTKWLKDNDFDMECFSVSMNYRSATVTDRMGDALRLEFDKESGTVNVFMKEEKKNR